MKHIRNVILTLMIITLPYAVNSCGDTGVILPENVSEFTMQNLPRLDQNIDGIYEAWVSIETSLDHGDDAYRTIGRFNISTGGSIVDKDGNPFSLNVSRIPDINSIEDAIISIEPPGDNDTILSISSTKILGGAKVNQSGKLYFTLKMDYPEILGIAAASLTSSSAKYTLAAPTTGDTNQYKKGAWFSQNTSGTVPGLTLATIPDSLDWIYQAWVFDVSTDTTSKQYNIGRFSSSSLPDDYYQCQQNTFPQWDLPGQEWTHPSCPITITDLSSGNYRLYVTLEPRHESSSNLVLPFNFLIFYGNIPTNVNYGDVMQLANVAKIPSGQIILSMEQSK